VCELPSLGRNTDFAKLSEKRVTTAVRKVLREQYQKDPAYVEVSCSAFFHEGKWHGDCRVKEKSLTYLIFIPNRR
jgi:hypothetical protein